MRRASHGLRQSAGTWLTVSLLFVVLVPSVGLWWFMQNAVQNDQFAVRQRLLDAYRAQLLLVRDAFEKNGQANASELALRRKQISSHQLFAELIRSGSADAAAIFGGEGKIAYPAIPVEPSAEPESVEWQQAETEEGVDRRKASTAYASLVAHPSSEVERARALQAEVRCLFQIGDGPAALRAIEAARNDLRLQRAADASGRIVLPNVELMAIELTSSKDNETDKTLIENLRRSVLDYEAPMPASQRRFLLSELSKYLQDPEVTRFREAEEAAVQFLENGGVRPNDAILRRASLTDFWQNASTHGDVVLLHRSDRLDTRLRQRFIGVALPNDVRVEIIPPGRETTDMLASTPAGDLLPGWRLAIALNDSRLMTVVQERAKSYFWAASVTVLVVGLLGLLAWGLVRRQLALTQLRNDLVANVSHELKTPLASMRLLVDTLLNTETFDERVTREYLVMIGNENVRLSRLITNFLTFSRIERNRYSFDFQPIAPGEIATEAAASVRDRFRDSTGDFSLVIAEGIPNIAADRDALVTALVNLLDNAWKYSAEIKKVELSVALTRDYVSFAVRDQGVGINRADRQRLFQRFEQGRSSTQSSVAGFGLGLNIVRFIVSAHRGKIALETEEGQGSTFTLLIPTK